MTTTGTRAAQFNKQSIMWPEAVHSTSITSLISGSKVTKPGKSRNINNKLTAQILLTL
jgi:hypothetical protein